MEIGILADSHLEAKHLNSEGYPHFLKKIKRLFQGVDHIIHAGDICVEDFLRDLESIAPITYCRGNCDSNPHWPRKIVINLGGKTIGLSHRFEEFHLFSQEQIDVFIHGHDHKPKIQQTPEGVLIVCPGSILHPRPRSHLYKFAKEEKPRPTVAFLKIDDEIVSAVIKKL